ncbi:acetate/propionate family kinase [Phenylobacterium sp.]|uniref:acetate/propionate family kinase n=1 Tax=Phenylobacterium sp. TaxID=1871053 RepID=UPI0035B3E0E3
MTDAVLTLNAGSSSLKFSIFEWSDGALRRTADGQIEGIGVAPHFVARAEDGAVAERRWASGAGLSHEELLGELLDWAQSHLGGDRLAAAGHRIVHGGSEFAAPARLDPATIAKLEALTPLAPLHQPHNLAAVRAVAALRPDIAQVGCFDTAFHRGHAPEVDRFGLPREWEAKGVKRYGFHGLSYEFIVGRMRELAPELVEGRLVAAHLGAGASLCAIAGGRSVDTTMGFTALDGLVMATRCGALDPGAVLYLAQTLTPGEIETVLYKRSGLLGVSQVSSDMRELLASDDPRAGEAVDLFVFRIVREIGALAASMGGLDGIVFTAGIGEHSPEIRARVCARLQWLGVSLDPEANARGEGRLNGPEARVAVWAVATDEDHMIAHHTWDLLKR